MFLYLIQHGKAKSKSEDPERGLSDEGKMETLKISQYIESAGIKADEIWVSPKFRSQQTADMITINTSLDNIIYEKDFLAPDDPVQKGVKLIKHLKKDIMIVGHLPYLSNLASYLLTGTVNYELIKFRNSGIVSLKYENEKWEILSIINPQMIFFS